MLFFVFAACVSSTPKDTSADTDSSTGDSAIHDSTDSGDTSSHTGDTSGSTGDYCAVQRFFAAECVMCHGATSPAGGLDLATDARTALVNVPSSAYAGQVLVRPADSAGSFLQIKLEGTQAADEGGVMPPSGSPPAAELDSVRAWIDAGATDACGDDTGSPDTGSAAYHPPGYADPANHGMDAKYQRDTCVTCHGADLTGGSVGVSCDTCHTKGWRTDCVFCHGGTDNTTGAPPRDIDNADTSLSFAPHTEHVTRGEHPTYGCSECHVTPTNALSSGHLFSGDATAGLAEVTFTGGISASGTYSAGTCSNSWCHGNGQGNNGSVTATSTVSCGTCHGTGETSESSWERMSGQHHKHVNDARLTCDTCHGGTVDASDAIIGPDQHVNGVVEVVTPSEITYSSGRCTGTCHGRSHSSSSW